MKLFFDQNFMINDGRLYPAYFLGWPAILAIGVTVSAPELMNPLLSALTVPALYGVLQHFVSRLWARAGILLFLSSPFLQIGAATEPSHTSCFMALAWSLYLYLYLRIAVTVRPFAIMLGFAVSLAFAFCIRPHTAVALGLPLLVGWAMQLRDLSARTRVRVVASFLLPTSVLASIFIAILWAQNGSPWRVGYSRYMQDIIDNGFRFTTFSLDDGRQCQGSISRSRSSNHSHL